MRLTDIARMRLQNQRISRPQKGSAGELVHWMGAMQAQDFPMAQWAVGVRLPGSAATGVIAAIDRGEIIRTHLLRPTWHFVAAQDVGWLLALTGPVVMASLRSRHRALGLSESLFAKSNVIIEEALAEGKHLLREELFARLTRAGVPLDNNRGHHLLLRAELSGLICSGASREGKQTYALLRMRIKPSKPLNREAALRRLAERYFASHGPATVRDFTWWSGLPATDARHALELVAPELRSAIVDSELYWYGEAAARSARKEERFHLLPAYDEILISYRERSALLPRGHQGRALSSNGIFRPVCVLDGKVIGTWKRTIEGDELTVRTELFSPPTRAVKELTHQAAARYAGFLGKHLLAVQL